MIVRNGLELVKQWRLVIFDIYIVDSNYNILDSSQSSMGLAYWYRNTAKLLIYDLYNLCRHLQDHQSEWKPFYIKSICTSG